MREMKATIENKHCGGTVEANHNDRSFDISKADNIGDIRKDQVWIFPDGEKPQRLPLEQYALRDFEMEYYSNRFGNAITAQKERHLKARQKSRAEGCTVKRYYDSIKTGPESTVLQVGKEWEYTDRKKFVQMVNAWKNDIEEETEDARIKVLPISVHGSEEDGSLHVHLTKSFEYKGKDGWVQDQDKCLEKLGYKLPDPAKKRGKYNNRKMTWTDQKRQVWYDIIERIDPEIKIDREPRPDNPKTKGKVNRAITEMTKLKRIIRELETEIESLQADLQRIGKDISKADVEKRMERIQASLERHKDAFRKMRDYVGDNEPRKTTTALEKESESTIEPDEDWER